MNNNEKDKIKAFYHFGNNKNYENCLKINPRYPSNYNLIKNSYNI